MTHYILHGGATSTENDKNDRFFRQFTASVDKPEVTIFLCYWARGDQAAQQKVIERDTPRILRNNNKEITLIVAENPEDLFAKLENADVLYVVGGEPEHIEPYYAELADLKQALDGKVYLGSSMGAYLISQSYLTSNNSSKRDVTEGLGILPIQTLCHWDAVTDKDQRLNSLKAYSEAPILTINEFEYVEMYA